MATIPNDQKILTSAAIVNTVYGGPASLQALNTWYTMDDISNTVKPYKVYTALLTQSGGNNVLTLVSGDNLTIGVTYIIKGYQANDDFSNVGGPPPVNESDYWTDYSFVATGTTPSVWTSTNLDYNTGAPVVTVLENTIGNIWFTYSAAGIYYIYSNNLFTQNKTLLFVGGCDYSGINDTTTGYGKGGSGWSNYPYQLTILSMQTQGDLRIDDVLFETPIEIRVYN